MEEYLIPFLSSQLKCLMSKFHFLPGVHSGKILTLGNNLIIPVSNANMKYSKGKMAKEIIIKPRNYIFKSLIEIN